MLKKIRAYLTPINNPEVICKLFVVKSCKRNGRVAPQHDIFRAHLFHPYDKTVLLSSIRMDEKHVLKS
jgi:hypothetical protein